MEHNEITDLADDIDSYCGKNGLEVCTINTITILQERGVIASQFEPLVSTKTADELKKEFEENFKNRLYIFDVCDECCGNGMDMEDSYKTCGECHGAGKTKRMNPLIWEWVKEKFIKQ